MNALHTIEQLLGQLSPPEKAQVLQWVSRDINGAFTGIEVRFDVLGGEACIMRTRIPVWLLVKARQDGLTEADILYSYPTLRAEDLTNAWAYARLHADEIQACIHDNETA